VVIADNRTHVYRNSRTLWEDTLAQNPACWAARGNLGDWWLAKGQPEKALAQYRAGLEHVPQPAEWQLQISAGQVLQDLHRPDEAFVHYNRAMDLATGEQVWVSHVNLGSCLQDMQRNVDALDHYRRAEQLHAGALDGRMQINVAGCHMHLGEFAEAAEHYREAMRLDAEPKWLLHFQLGQCLHETRQLDAAIAEYRRAWQLHPGFMPIQDRLNQALAQRAGR
jgi:tetratricopeptide (TPR) repeat protein